MAGHWYRVPSCEVTSDLAPLQSTNRSHRLLAENGGLHIPRALDLGRMLAYFNSIMAEKSDPNYKIIAENRRARFDYFIESDLEVGIVLVGSEVKALRTGQSNIAESYASVEGGELWLINGYISAYKQAGVFGHDERRRRKLLVSNKELSRLWQAVGREGMTLVPLVMYFNHVGRVKLKIGVAKGKKLSDKRETEAKRDWGRQKQRLLKQG